MDIGDLFAGLNALDAVRVTRNPDGTYAGLVSDSEVVPVTDILNHGAEHVTIGLPEQIIAAIFSAVFPLPTLPLPAENASGVSLTPTLTSKEGAAKPYVLAKRDTTDQTLVGNNTDLLFNGVSDVQSGLSATVSPPLPSGAQLAYRARHEDDSSGHWTDWTDWRSFSTL